MSLSTPIDIVRSGTTNKVNYDILNDNLTLCRDLLAIYPHFQTHGLECSVTVFLNTTAPCQVKINTESKDGEWNDFMENVVYSTRENKLLKNVILSANACPYTIRISF